VKTVISLVYIFFFVNVKHFQVSPWFDQCLVFNLYIQYFLCLNVISFMIGLYSFKYFPLIALTSSSLFIGINKCIAFSN
jgi:hypothetical protein